MHFGLQSTSLFLSSFPLSVEPSDSRRKWRSALREEIDALKKSIAEMSSKKAAIEQTIAQTEATPAVDFATGEKYEKYLDDSETDPNFIR